MLYVIGALALSIVGVLLKGLLHLSLADVVVVLAVPVMFLYKLLGNRPSFLAFGAIVGSFAGGVSALWGCVIVPNQYFYELWGWLGVVLGVVAFLLFIIPELILFLVVALFKGGAAVYVGNFLSGICFGLAGLCLLNSGFSGSIWSRFSRRKSDEAPAESPVPQSETREQAIRQARTMITDDQLTEFFRAIRDKGYVGAVQMINGALDADRNLDSIFYTGKEFGFLLSVRRVTKSSFHISFGCQAGPLAGDGGEWQVEFDDRGHVVSVSGGGSWIS